MTRAEVVDYFRSLFHAKLQRPPSHAWSGLVCAVADLPAPELLEEVRQAYADNLVDSMVADLAEIERDILSQKTPVLILIPRPRTRPRRMPNCTEAIWQPN